MIDPRVGLATLLWTGLVAGGGSAATATPTSSPTEEVSPSVSAAPSSALPDEVDIESAGALAIEATWSVDWMVLVEGRAWVAGMGDGVGVLDASGTLQQSVAVGGWCESMDVGFGAVWSASCAPAGIIRIDVETMAVDRAPFDVGIPSSEASVGAGEGAVWLVAGVSADLLLGVDPETLEIEHRYPIPAGAAGVRAGFGGVWVTRPDANELLHVDPSSGQVVATIAVGPGPRFLTELYGPRPGSGSVAADDDAVWVTAHDVATIWRLPLD